MVYNHFVGYLLETAMNKTEHGIRLSTLSAKCLVNWRSSWKVIPRSFSDVTWLRSIRLPLMPSGKCACRCGILCALSYILLH